MEIILARHGLSIANKKGLLSGQHNSRLTAEGKQQAQDLARRLKGLEIEKIYSSPLNRAMQTALPFAKAMNMPIKVDNRLMEVSFGSFEGKPNDAIEKAFGQTQRDLFNTYKFDFRRYGGESSRDVEVRVRAFLDELKDQKFQLVLIVTHGGIIRWIHFILTGEKIGPIPNAEELTLKT